MNSPFSQSTASKIVSLTFDEDKSNWIKEIYSLILGRLPSVKDELSAKKFLRDFPDSQSDHHAATAFTQSILCSNEFLYLR